MRTAILIIAATCLYAAQPRAENESAKDAFKQTERGFGRLLQGMGQEIKKGLDAVGSAAKKEQKKQGEDDKKNPERKQGR